MQKGFVFLAFTLLCSLSTVNAQQLAVNASFEKAVETKAELLSWESKIHDFGDIPQSVPAVAEFELTNNSQETLIITSVKGSCGCTVAKHDEQPVLPGESTTITATYNAAKIGPFTKSVTVHTSLSDQPEVLKVKGQVLEK